MKKTGERGFSIIELLIVCAVIGIIAAVAVPHLQKAIIATQNGNMLATMRTIASTQVDFLARNGRFGRLNEINNVLSGSIGTQSGSDLNRGKFVISMVPAVPTDIELRTSYKISALRDVAGEGVVYRYDLTESGFIDQILPATP